jgi:hypothetical protein
MPAAKITNARPYPQDYKLRHEKNTPTTFDSKLCHTKIITPHPHKYKPGHKKIHTPKLTAIN